MEDDPFARERHMTADLVALATRHDRYGNRRITALPPAAGRLMNHRRVGRTWLREGLRGPGGHPKRGRLSLTDGSCIRLRPEQANHVWPPDFAEDPPMTGEGPHAQRGRRVGARALGDPGRTEAEVGGRGRRPLRRVQSPGRSPANPVRERDGVHRRGGSGRDRRSAPAPPTSIAPGSPWRTAFAPASTPGSATRSFSTAC